VIARSSATSKRPANNARAIRFIRINSKICPFRNPLGLGQQSVRQAFYSTQEYHSPPNPSALQCARTSRIVSSGPSYGHIPQNRRRRSSLNLEHRESTVTTHLSKTAGTRRETEDRRDVYRCFLEFTFVNETITERSVCPRILRIGCACIKCKDGIVLFHTLMLSLFSPRMEVQLRV